MKKQIIKKLRDLHVSQNSKSVIILVGDNRFKCDLFVLKAYSNIFDDYTESCIISLPYTVVTPWSFTHVYSWMFLDQESLITHPRIVEIFLTAQYLKIELLVQLCWRSFKHFYESNAALLHTEAKKFKLKILSSWLFRHIGKYFLKFVASKHFRQLCVDEVCTLLSLSTIGVNTELEVMMAILVWIMHNVNYRSIFLQRLMKCVRFHLLPMTYLASFCYGKPASLISKLLLTKETKKLASKCIDQMLGQGSVYNKLLPQRKWIIDTTCEYHHNEICTYPIILNYEIFTKYLQELQAKPDHWRSFDYKEEIPLRKIAWVNENKENQDNEYSHDKIAEKNQYQSK